MNEDDEEYSSHNDAPPIAGWLMEWLAQMVASTVYLALNNVDDCTAVRGQARFDLAVNRRRPVDGQIYRLPYEMGHTDQRLSILQFSAGDRSLGGIVHAAMQDRKSTRLNSSH